MAGLAAGLRWGVPSSPLGPSSPSRAVGRLREGIWNWRGFRRPSPAPADPAVGKEFDWPKPRLQRDKWARGEKSVLERGRCCGGERLGWCVQTNSQMSPRCPCVVAKHQTDARHPVPRPDAHHPTPVPRPRVHRELCSRLNPPVLPRTASILNVQREGGGLGIPWHPPVHSSHLPVTFPPFCSSHSHIILFFLSLFLLQNGPVLKCKLK